MQLECLLQLLLLICIRNGIFARSNSFHPQLQRNHKNNAETIRKIYPKNDTVLFSYNFNKFALDDPPFVRLRHWRAPFTSFGEIWPPPAVVSRGNRVFRVASTSTISLSVSKSGGHFDVIESSIERLRRAITSAHGVSHFHGNSDILKPYIHRFSSAASYAPGPGKQYQVLFPTYTCETIHRDSIYRVVSDSFPARTRNPSPEQQLPIYIHTKTDGEAYPHLDMDESYALLIDERGVYVYANETWGTVRALESLSQLFWLTVDDQQLHLNETCIYDRPRYPHRGLLVDTARHFISPGVLKRNFDAMAASKMNVFHWHFSDDQAFAIALDRHPELAKKGSYPGQSYTTADVRDLLNYARLRGIRLVPELDLPDHTLSWSKSHPELFSRCMESGQWTGFYGPLEAAPTTYKFLTSLLAELFALFPDRVFHLGGDEVDQTCWRTSPVTMPLAEISSKLFEIIASSASPSDAGRRVPIFWQEVLENRLDVARADSIVQLWKQDISSLDLAKHRLIFSTCWYLDNLANGERWIDLFNCEPTSYMWPSAASNLIGGEACMWSEYVSDDNILQRIWPLASATAARLWSPATLVDVSEVGGAFEEHRCRMAGRGIPQGGGSGPGYCPSTGALTKFFAKEKNTQGRRSSISLFSTETQVLSFCPITLLVGITWGFVIAHFRFIDILRSWQCFQRVTLPTRWKIIAAISLFMVCMIWLTNASIFASQ